MGRSLWNYGKSSRGDDDASVHGRAYRDWDDAEADDDDAADLDDEVDPDGDGAAYDSAEWDAASSAGLPVPYGDDDERALADWDDTGPHEPVIIAGTGTSMGNPFIKRRERPLTMRVALLMLIGSVMVTGLFAAKPLGLGGSATVSAFEALSGMVVLDHPSGFFYYTAQSGDTIESLAARYNVQVGGIYELNNLVAGGDDDLQVGAVYKIPYDSAYGKNFQPPRLAVQQNAGGGTIFGSNWWNSYAGTPPAEAACSPDGGATPLAWDLNSPNWGSNWVRGFSWFHNGIDISAPYGNPIHAAQAGQVIWAGYDATNGFGWSVVINHCNGLSTLYGHMSQVMVHAGQNVDMRTVIGLEGCTGWCTGPHLHFSVLVNNNFVNPYPYFNYDLNTLTHDDPNRK